MIKAGVGLGAQVDQRLGRDLLAGEPPQNVGGDLGVGPTGEGRDLALAQTRPSLGNVKTAIGGEPRQQSFQKADRRRAASG